MTLLLSRLILGQIRMIDGSTLQKENVLVSVRTHCVPIIPAKGFLRRSISHCCLVPEIHVSMTRAYGIRHCKVAGIDKFQVLD